MAYFSPETIEKVKKIDLLTFLKATNPEEVVYFSKAIDVRANWDVEQVFDLSIPYTPEPKKKEDKKKPVKSGF